MYGKHMGKSYTRIRDPKGRAVGQRNSKLMFELNHTMPQTEEYFKIFIVVF